MKLEKKDVIEYLESQDKKCMQMARVYQSSSFPETFGVKVDFWVGQSEVYAALKKILIQLEEVK